MALVRHAARGLVPLALFALAITVGGALRPEPASTAVVLPSVAREDAHQRLLAAAPGLSPRTLDLALRAWSRALERGLTRSSRLTVIDYSLPSTTPRLWVVDVSKGLVLFHELVAHGKRTGDNLATAFSNRPGSEQSSLGTFLTGETYVGKHGLSLRLKGLEPGVNDQAEARGIVIHGAPYVSAGAIATLGRLGRSQGCPAVPADVSASIIRAIAGGTLVFSYYPAPDWERSSPFTKGS